MEADTPCEHEWTVIQVGDTWSGPTNLSLCSLCHAFLREWLPGPSRDLRHRPSPRVAGWDTDVGNPPGREVLVAPYPPGAVTEPASSGSPWSGQVPRQRD